MKNDDFNDAQVSARISAKLRERLFQAAIEENCSISDILRDALERRLGHVERQAENAKRNAFVFEYLHALLEFLIHQEHPDIRPRLIAVAREKAKAHHGLW